MNQSTFSIVLVALALVGLTLLIGRRGGRS